MHLFNSGAWIYEVDNCFKKPFNNKKNNNERLYHLQDESSVSIPNQVKTNQQAVEIN